MPTLCTWRVLIELFSCVIRDKAVRQKSLGVTPVPHALTKHVDKSSVQLLQACASGQHLKQAVLTVSRGNGKGSVEYMKITLEDVVISSYQTGGHAGDPLPIDQVSLTFGKVKVESGNTSVELTVGDTAGT